MKTDLDQRYMQVAKACLQVLNNVSPAADRSQQIIEVYKAIDVAISDLYKHQEVQLANLYIALKEIAQLEEGENELSQAVKIAQSLLPSEH